MVAIRIAPTPFLESAPLWGLLTGSLTGAVLGVLARVSGGPLGAGRLSSVGPNGAEAGLVAVLEVGVTAALVAGVGNWLLLRHHIKKLAADGVSGVGGSPEEGWPSAPKGDPFAKAAKAAAPASAVDETDDAGGHRIFVDPWADQPDAD